MKSMFARHLGTVVAAALIASGWSSGAKADFAYGFARETISNLTVNPTLTVTPGSQLSTSSTAAATLNGTGPSNSDPLNAPQAFSGTSAAPPQNDFAKTATIGNTAIFGRGNSQIAALSPGTASVVAESYAGSTGRVTGNSAVTAGLSFTTTATQAYTISYNFQTEEFTTFSGTGSSSAAYQFVITIKNSAGVTVFNSQTANTNLTNSSPPGGTDSSTGPTLETVVTPSLGAGTYSLTFTIAASAAAQVTPEPSSVALLGLGGVAGLIARRRLRRGAGA